MNNEADAPNQPSYEVYLRTWEVEQQHTRTRWTVFTFFASVSFAIFGFALQCQSSSLAAHAQVFGLVIYWFAYILFLRFNCYTNILREYLETLEKTTDISINIHEITKGRLSTGWGRYFSAQRLLLYFGLMYAIGVGLTQLFHYN